MLSVTGEAVTGISSCIFISAAVTCSVAAAQPGVCVCVLAMCSPECVYVYLTVYTAVQL